MNDRERVLKIVRLIEPDLCLHCRLAEIVTVDLEDGSQRRMLHCRRFDCDNWAFDNNDPTPIRIE